MEKIIFTKVPRKAKRYFRGKLGVIQRAVDFKDADRKIKTWAKTLSKREEESNVLSLKIVDGKKQLFKIKNLLVTATDAEDGLLGLLSRNAMHHNNSESLKALATAQELLQNSNEEINDANQVEKDDEQLSDEEVFSSTDIFKERSNDNETESENEPGAIAAPAAPTAEDNVESTNEPKDEPDEDFVIAKPQVQMEESQEQLPTEELQESPKVDQNFSQVIQLGDYLDTTGSEEKLSKFSSKDFDVKPVLHNMGYTEEPQDRFDKNLNKDLMELLDQYSLIDQQSAYEDACAAVYRDLSKKLADNYNDLNQVAIQEEAAHLCEQKLQELESYATADQDQINAEVDNQEANYQRERKLARDNKVKAYEARLKDEDDADFATYSRKLREDSQQRITLRQNKLETDSQAEKEQSTKQVISDRNKALADKKVELVNEAENKIIADYRQKRLQFQKDQADFRKAAREKADQVSTDRKNAEETAFEHKMRLKAQQEEQRRNDLLAKQVKQTEAAQNKKSAREAESLKIMQELVAKIDQNSHKDRETMLQMVEKFTKPSAENTFDANNSSLLPVVQDNDEKVNDADEVKVKKSNKWLIAAPLCFIVGAILACGIMFGIDKQHQTAAPTDKKVQVSKPKPVKSKAKTTKSKVSKSRAKNAVKTRKRQAKKSNNNLDEYVACATWTQKVDILNGALGQHDDRALKQINATEPTELSRLYEAIVLNDQVTERKLWLEMKPRSRSQVSRSARNAVTLSFYNIKDWEHGWEVKNSIYG